MNDVKRSQGVAVGVRPLCISEWVGPILASSGRELGMQTLALMQVGTTPDWVGPTMAISLAILALSFLGMAIAVAVAVFRLTDQVKKIGSLVDGLQDDIARTLKGVRNLSEQAQDVMILVRQETGAFAQTARRLRRKVVRGADQIEAKLADLETLYDVVHGEVENTALDLAAALRSLRRGNGMLGRVRRILVPSR
ncbi:MAG: hypothetical protein K0S19_1018 [Geminicoccaceae bacterium]|nr:hypothetical protein [Geminicoccaceae bacterium]